ncbi:MAG: hypothetical protein ACYTFW_22065 [Planctomycetota bacterium]
MKLHRKKVLKIIVAVVIIALVASFVLLVRYSPWVPVTFFVWFNKTQRMQVRLLCETDHQALLNACRELLRQVDEGNLKPGLYPIHDGSRHPEVSRFPQPILDLAPQYVKIEHGYITMPMHGAIASFGVFAYPEDFKEPFPGFIYGHRKLIEGLWYYDDGYVRDYDSDYDRRIEALLQRAK